MGEQRHTIAVVGGTGPQGKGLAYRFAKHGHDVVIGSRSAERAAEAAAAIAGFAVLNDVTMRDWQYRTQQWLQGKTFEHTTPFGPVLVTPDELPGGVRPTLDISCTVDGDTVQKANTADLVFDPVALVEYISTIVTLRPGDVIATGPRAGSATRAGRRAICRMDPVW